RERQGADQGALRDRLQQGELVVGYAGPRREQAGDGGRRGHLEAEDQVVDDRHHEREQHVQARRDQEHQPRGPAVASPQVTAGRPARPAGGSGRAPRPWLGADAGGGGVQGCSPPAPMDSIGPNGLTFPRTYTGISSSGAAAVTHWPPAAGAPVQASRQPAPAGRYTSRSLAPSVTTGATRMSPPNKNWSWMSQQAGSAGKSRDSGRIGGKPVECATVICSMTYGRSRSRRNIRWRMIWYSVSPNDHTSLAAPVCSEPT